MVKLNKRLQHIVWKYAISTGEVWNKDYEREQEAIYKVRKDNQRQKITKESETIRRKTKQEKTNRHIRDAKQEGKSQNGIKPKGKTIKGKVKWGIKIASWYGRNSNLARDLQVKC